MENQQKRQTDVWFVNQEFTGTLPFKSGPGAYDLSKFQNKQSWNKGQIPFGSNSLFQNGGIFTNPGVKGGIRNLPTLNSANPGPGQYDLPNVDIIKLNGQSPLRAAFQEVQNQKKKNQQQQYVNLLNKLNNSVVRNNQEKKQLNHEIQEIQRQKRIQSMQEAPLNDNLNSNEQSHSEALLKDLGLQEKLNSFINLRNVKNENRELKNNQSSSRFQKNSSQAVIKSQTGGSINDQIMAFLKNDPSATHLGDIGSIFGNNAENQIAQSVNKFGSLSKLRHNDSSTIASSFMHNKSKIKNCNDGYMAQKPSSINLKSLREKTKKSASRFEQDSSNNEDQDQKQVQLSPKKQFQQIDIKPQKSKPFIGSTIKRNQDKKIVFEQNIQDAYKQLLEPITYEQQYLKQRNVLQTISNQEQRNQNKSFLTYTDNTIGPGYYDPNLQAYLKSSPSARISSTQLAPIGEQPPLTQEELSDLITGKGNLTQKINQAKGQIEQYLSDIIKANGKKIKIGDSLDPDSQLRLPQIGKQFDQKSLNTVTHRESTNNQFLSQERNQMQGKLQISTTQNQKILSQAASSSFLSGVKRTDFSKQTIDNPGPGQYKLNYASEKGKIIGSNFSQTVEVRDTIQFAMRNEKSPFINSTAIQSPAPGQYFQIKGLHGGTEKINKRLRQIDVSEYMNQPQRLDQQIQSILHNEASGFADDVTQEVTSPYQRSYSLLFGLNLRQNKENKPKRYGIKQLSENIQDPVRLAVKEVLKAERNKNNNVSPPGPGYYQNIELNNLQNNKKQFSVKQQSFNSFSPRFVEKVQIDPIQRQKNKLMMDQTQKLKTSFFNADQIQNKDIETILPIYDLQMMEGPQIKARLLMKELQDDDEEQNNATQKPKIIHGSAYKTVKLKIEADNQQIQEELENENIELPMHSSNATSFNQSLVKTLFKKKLGQNEAPISSHNQINLNSAMGTDFKIPSELLNYQSEALQKYNEQRKEILANTIKQQDNLVSFNSSSPRFQTQKQIRLVTGQDQETGNLYIVQDEKNSLGPGYYKSPDDIQQMKQQFNEILIKNRAKKIKQKEDNQMLLLNETFEAFGSSTNREVGSSIKTKIEQTSYQGKAGQYYDSLKQTSILKPTFNVKLKKEASKKMKQIQSDS